MESLQISDHLDEPIIELAKNFARLGVADNPDYSCSGHVTDTKKQFGEYAGFEEGYWPFTLQSDDPRADTFLIKLEELVSEFPNVTLEKSQKSKEGDPERYAIHVSFHGCEGIIFEEAESLLENMRSGNRNRVPISNGIQFYQSNIINFWNKFNELVIQFLQADEIERPVELLSNHTRAGIDQALIEKV